MPPPTAPAITPATTAVTAFVGHTLEGPINQVMVVKSFLEYSQSFGGLSTSSELAYAVLQFFRNGGERALIVRQQYQRRARRFGGVEE